MPRPSPCRKNPTRPRRLTLIVDVGHQCRDPAGVDKTGVLACSSPNRPRLRGRADQRGPARGPRCHRGGSRIDPATKEPRFRVIGCDLWSDDPGFAEATKETGITGICGSGIIEAVAEMRMAGLLDASGLIGSAEATGTARAEPTGRTHAYLVHDATDTERPAHSP